MNDYFSLLMGKRQKRMCFVDIKMLSFFMVWILLCICNFMLLSPAKTSAIKKTYRMKLWLYVFSYKIF